MISDMQDDFVTTPESISLLFGEAFYIVPEQGDAVDAPAKPAKEAAKPVTAAIPKIDPPTTPQVQEPVRVDPPVVQPRAGIQWRAKPTSKMMFILQQAELKDPILTEFLKKIVEAIGIPFDSAGFGIINGPVNLAEFEQMPNRYGVVFDGDLWMSPNVATTFGDKEVFFSMRLAYLQNDADSKRELWGYLKNLKEMLK